MFFAIFTATLDSPMSFNLGGTLHINKEMHLKRTGATQSCSVVNIEDTEVMPTVYFWEFVGFKDRAAVSSILKLNKTAKNNQ